MVGGGTPAQVWGYNSQVWMVGGVPPAKSGWCGVPHPGGYPILMGGYPIHGGYSIWGRYPIWGEVSHIWMGGTPSWGEYPSQVLTMGGTQGIPQARSGWGYPGYPPHQHLARVPPILRWGTPTIKTWLGYPQPWDGVPPTIKTWPGYPPPWDGVPPDLGWGTPLRQSSITSTCYGAGGMPLAFTQDFLVSTLVSYFKNYLTNWWIVELFFKYFHGYLNFNFHSH